jgi:hypothetical protein
MTLRDTLEGAFSGDDFDAGEAFKQLAELYKALDLPALPFDPSAIADQVTAIGNLDASSTADEIVSTFSDAAGALAALPGADALGGPIMTALTTIQALGQDSAGMIESLRTSFVPASPDEPGAQRVARAMAGIADLGATPLPALLHATLPTLTPEGSGRAINDVLSGGAALPALLASLRSLMELAAGIERATLLGTAIGSLPSTASIAALRTDLAAWDVDATVARITSGDPVADIVADVEPALTRIREMEQALADLVAGTAAILATFDLGRVQATWRDVGSTLTSLDVSAVNELADGLVGGLDGLIKVPPGPPAASPEAFAAEVATLLGGIADAIEAIEVTRFTTAIEGGAGRVLAPIREATDALTEVRTAVVAAEDAVAEAVRAIDLSEISTAIHAITDPLKTALDEIRGVLHTLSAQLGTAAGATVDAIDALRAGTDTIATAMNTAFGAIATALDEIDLAGRAAQVTAALEPVKTALADVHIGEAADAAAEGIERVATVIEVLPFDLLPDSARAELDTVIEPIKTFDFDTEITQRLADQLDEIRAAIDEDVLGQVRAAQAEAADFLASIDPRPPLQAFEHDTFDVAVAKIQEVNPDALLAPLHEALAEVPDLGALLDPADALFDELLAGYDSFAPRSLLAPLTDPVDAARVAIAGQLHLDAARSELDGARASALAAIEDVSIVRAIDALITLVEGVLPRPGSGRGGVLGQVVLRLTEGTEVLEASSFAIAGDWVAGRAQVTAASDALNATRDGLSTLRDTVRGLDARPILTEVQSGYDTVTAAIKALPHDKPLRRRLLALVPPSPALLIEPLEQGRGDVVQSVTGAMSVASHLAAVDLRPIDAAVDRLAHALAPLLALRDWLVAWIERAGVVVDEADLGAAARTFLTILRDQVTTAAGIRLEAQLRGTLREVMTSTIDALLTGVDQVESTLGLLSLEPLVVELEALHAERRTELAALRPSTQLADIVATLRSIDHDIRTFDPLADVRPALDALNAAVADVDTKLRPTVLLAPVMDGYDRTIAAMTAIDIDNLFGPILEALEQVTSDVENGVTDVGSAFGKLQAALP